MKKSLWSILLTFSFFFAIISCSSAQLKNIALPIFSDPLLNNECLVEKSISVNIDSIPTTIRMGNMDINIAHTLIENKLLWIEFSSADKKFYKTALYILFDTSNVSIDRITDFSNASINTSAEKHEFYIGPVKWPSRIKTNPNFSFYYEIFNATYVNWCTCMEKDNNFSCTITLEEINCKSSQSSNDIYGTTKQIDFVVRK